MNNKLVALVAQHTDLSLIRAGFCRISAYICVWHTKRLTYGICPGLNIWICEANRARSCCNENDATVCIFFIFFCTVLRGGCNASELQVKLCLHVELTNRLLDLLVDYMYGTDRFSMVCTDSTLTPEVLPTISVT